MYFERSTIILEISSNCHTGDFQTLHVLIESKIFPHFLSNIIYFDIWKYSSHPILKLFNLQFYTERASLLIL